MILKNFWTFWAQINNENISNKDLLEIILYGDEKLSSVFNTKILEATLRYIRA